MRHAERVAEARRCQDARRPPDRYPARRFGAAGHTVALIARRAGRLAELTAVLSREGIEAHAFPADVLDRASLSAALQEAADVLGPIEILQFSPVPRADFMKPVLDTSADDLDAPLDFSVKGPVTAVHAGPTE